MGQLRADNSFLSMIIASCKRYEMKKTKFIMEFQFKLRLMIIVHLLPLLLQCVYLRSSQFPSLWESRAREREQAVCERA
jgi:hypothetical protein